MDERQAWDLYFASLVSFTAHPGYKKANTEKPSVKELAQLADVMIGERRQRWQQ